MATIQDQLKQNVFMKSKFCTVVKLQLEDLFDYIYLFNLQLSVLFSINFTLSLKIF